MRITLCVTGRLRAGPERMLVDDYLTRFERTGRAIGLGPVKVIEVEDKSKQGMQAEAKLLRSAIPKGASLFCLDERGKQQKSEEFAASLGNLRDTGIRDCAFVIGGADGIDPSLRSDAHHLLSFGKMVWPHMLVRVMLAEQLYRASSILAGSPYHRA